MSPTTYTVPFILFPLSFSEFEKIVEDRDGDASKGHLELEQLGRVLETINKEVEGGQNLEQKLCAIAFAKLHGCSNYC